MIHGTKEYILYAEQNQIRPSDYVFVPAPSFSPYMECAPKTLNRLSLDGGVVEVNPYYKYEKIFAMLFDSFETEQFKDVKNYVFDFWIRESYRYERLGGMTMQALKRRQLAKEILQGECGGKTRRALGCFKDDELDAVVECLMQLQDGGNEIHLFTRAVKKIFQDVYLYILDHKEILIYVGETEKIRTKKKLQSLQFLFLPMGMEMEVFWDKHFGVLGIEDASRLDEAVLI